MAQVRRFGASATRGHVPTTASSAIAAGSSLGAGPESAEGTRAVHVARQPVYDRSGEVVGYELLFRETADTTVASRSNAYATSNVIVTAFTEVGMTNLVGDRLCFVNLTREFVVGELDLPFDPGQAVLEVLETIHVDDEVVAGVATLVARGYAIALDDFVWDPATSGCCRTPPTSNSRSPASTR